MFGLKEKYIDFIINTLNAHIENKNAKYYIFGSRAKNCYKTYSDIDIAINSDNKISDDKMSSIIADFENSTLPYEVDIVDLNSIDENFRKLILDDLKEIKK